MRKIILLLTLTATPLAAQHAPRPAAPAPAAAARYSTTRTLIGTLFADRAAKALVAKHFPDLLSSRAVTAGMADGMTLRSLQRFRPAEFTDARLAALDAAFAGLPAK